MVDGLATLARCFEDDTQMVKKFGLPDEFLKRSRAKRCVVPLFNVEGLRR
jgi:hypothetical protein